MSTTVTRISAITVTAAAGVTLLWAVLGAGDPSLIASAPTPTGATSATAPAPIAEASRSTTASQTSAPTAAPSRPGATAAPTPSAATTLKPSTTKPTTKAGNSSSPEAATVSDEEPRPDADSDRIAPEVCYARANIICASKSENTLRYFRDGRLDMTVDVRFGKPGYESPSGTWKVEKKTRNAWSYLFNVTLPFSLEYDLKRGIYIHYSQAWAEAGPSYPGSHGCVNIKDWATAEKLFNRVPVGTTVYVY